jgi:hypothetical protein
MSTEAEKNNDSKARPKVSGMGTVTVDGEVVYEPSMSWSKEVEDAVEGAAQAASAAAGAAASAVEGAAQTVHARPVDPDPGNDWYAKAYAYYPKKGAIWFGVALVVIGALLLLDRAAALFPELSMVFGGVSLWRFWPVLVIIGGIAVAFSPDWSPTKPERKGSLTAGHFFDGLSTATIGLVLLGCSLKLVSWSVWLAALSYWPVLLVIGGLSILSSALKTDWFRVIGSVIFILTLIAVACSVWLGPLPLPEPFDALAQIGSYRGFIFWD